METIKEHKHRWREHAIERFPPILITLISIIQAIALENWWGSLHANLFNMEFSIVFLNSLILHLIVLINVFFIWVMYFQQALRLNWVPRTIDFVLPFYIGIMQFLLIQVATNETIGYFMFIGMLIVHATGTVRRTGWTRYLELYPLSDAATIPINPSENPKNFYWTKTVPLILTYTPYAAYLVSLLLILYPPSAALSTFLCVSFLVMAICITHILASTMKEYLTVTE